MRVMPESEPAASLAILNHPATRLPGPSYLHELVQQSGHTDNAAVEYLAADGRRSSISYAEFHHLSDRLAQKIASLRPRQPDNDSVNHQFVVPVLVPQHPNLYVALLAILKAGGAFCPLNLDAPLERVKFILKDVSAAVVITTSEYASSIPRVDGLTVLLLDDESREEPVTQSISSLQTTSPKDLAYVMYTSGSTGTPKGVGVSHEAATQSLLAHDRHIPQFFRFLQFAAPTFDVSVFEIFFPLFRGCTLVCCDRGRMLDDLPLVLRTMNIDACELTPSVAGSLLRKRENAPCLRLLLTIGEMLTVPVIEEFGGGNGRPSMLWAMYGPTEAAIHCTLQPALACDAGVGNIGFPLDTVSAFILEVPEDSRPSQTPRILGVGEVGELAVGGSQLASGYLNRPEITSFAFIDSPYGPLYRTQDKARILHDGTIECLGRIGGGQVKLRGQRIELGEIEQVALRTSGCHGAMAAVIGGILVLFCAVDIVDNMEADIRNKCEAWLPSFMVPGDIIVSKEFSRLPSGKVDRRRLLSEYSSLREERPPKAAEFKDAVEQELCELAGSVLHQDILPPTNLAAAGMDSLTAIRFTAMLREQGFELSALDILKSRSVSQLYQHLTNSATSKKGDRSSGARELSIESIPISQSCLETVEQVLPCTPLQSAMLAETASKPQAYCNWLELSITGGHDADRIRSWILEITNRNDILRTGFLLHEASFVQLVWRDSSAVPISLQDSGSKDFSLATEEDLLHPFRVRICTDLDETRILLQMHHAIFDGWTLDLLLADLRALSSNHPVQVRPQFREFVDYNHSGAFANQCNSARSFWAETLIGFQPSAFPSLLDAPPQQSQVRSHVTRLDFDPKTVRRMLQELACSPQVIFQAALAWLWGSMVGGEDVVTGLVASGRTVAVPGIEHMMGPCIATLPLRTNLAQTRTVRDLLETVQAVNRSALANASLPLADIRKAAGIAPGQTLYDILFVYQESLYSSSQDGGRVKEVSHMDYLETKILVEVEPKDGHYACRLTYHTDAMSHIHASLFIDEFRCIARYFLGNMDANLVSTRTVFPEQLLSTYNLEPRSFTGIADLATAVEQAVSKTPDKAALCFAHLITEHSAEVEQVSYREFNARANKIARYIRSAGCSTGEVVSIVMEKSVLLYAGVLGIVKAGCSYLPLLPNTPMARIQLIHEQANVKLSLTDNSATAKLSQMQGHQVMNLQEQDLTDIEDTNLALPADPGRIAVIVYTSGSTGVPKGVCVTQLNVTSNLDVLSRIYPIKGDSRLLQSCSQAFDVSVFEMFFSWTQGMTLCSATNDTVFEDLERSIRALKVTHLSMTPTVASLVDPQSVPDVEFLVTSGEAMTEKVARSWWRQLYQGYGPSETTNICTVKKMGPTDVIRHLGSTFENTSVVVLFQDSVDTVPYGCLGELCFGGDQVAQGYLNMSELTSTKFINHPKYGRLYRSGDLGSMLPDGSLMITGRVDDQIKLRGQRIELNEINATIRKSTDISDCFTILASRNEFSTPQLASFYVPRGYFDATVTKVRPLDDRTKDITASVYRLLLAGLPVYMVPSYLIPISRLPMTPSGKLDRAWFKQAFQTLEPQYLQSTALNTSTDHDDKELTETERQVLDVVNLALSTGGSSVSRWTPLASFGLDSISAIGLSRQLQKQFGRRLPISVILQNPCVARLAQAMEDLEEDNEEKISLDVFPADWVASSKARCEAHGIVVEKILPCTPLQEAMLAASVTGKSYLNNMLFRLHADVAKMQKYWTVMCERHDILRTCFVTTDMAEHPFAQIVLGNWQPKWFQFEASETTVEEAITQHSAGHAVFDTCEPPVSFAIIRHGGDTYLSFTCHHALYDGIAVGVLLHEVEMLAHGMTLEAPPAVEPFLRAMLSQSSAAEDFWKRQLLDFRVKELPTSAEPVASQPADAHSTRTTHITIPLSDITERTKSLGCSLLSVCQAAWALVLTTLVNDKDICFGNVVSGRSVAVNGIERLVAPCFNTVPVRMNLSDIRQNLDLMKALNALNTQIIQHQFTSLRRIQSSALHGASQHLFDTLLILQQPARTLDSRLWSLERDIGEMDIPLVCEFRPDTQRDRLTVQLHYDCSLYSNPFLDVILDMLQHFMALCLTYPSSQLPRSSSLPHSIASKLSNLQLKRKADTDSDSVSGPDESKWSEVELRVRSVLAKLSSVPEQNIKRTTTIYQLGLDSINAVQIASLLRDQGIRISAGDVITQKTCANLAKKASKPRDLAPPLSSFDFARYRLRAESQLDQHSISKDTVEDMMPCTPLQAGMLVQFIQSHGHDYFNFIDLQLDEDIQIDGLTKAWKQVANTHPMLRTGFVSVDDSEFPFAMLQYKSASTEQHISLVDGKMTLRWHSDDWRRETASEVLKALHQPLWRVVCVDRSSRGLEMHIAIHHALYDAQSLQRILEDLSLAFQGGRLSGVPASQEVVKDIIGQSTQAHERKAFWQSQADSVVINHFPTLTPLRVERRTSLIESFVSRHKHSSLEEALSKSGFTVQAALQAAWTRVLSACLGESSVTFGVVLSGRNSQATQDAVFPCISTLPVISSNRPSNRQLLQAMLDCSRHLYQSQHLPLSKIQKWLGFPDGRLFDTLLVYQKLAPSSAASLPWTVVADEGTVDYSLSIEVEPSSDDTLRYRFTSFSDVVPREHARLLLQQFDAVVCDLALNPEGHENDVFHKAPTLFSVTPAEEPEVHCEEKFLHQFVETQALKTPDKTALEFVTGFQGTQPLKKTWSYRSLDEYGNRVARILQPNVTTGDIVAVLFDKCPEAFFSILGALKAGCAFVALDPGAPSSRKQFILEDSGASVLLMSRDISESLEFPVDVPVVVVDKQSLSEIDGSPVILDSELTPQHTCYCLYTSGTTGTPKGCEITHENSVQAMLAFQRLFAGHWDAQSKWLQFASFHFDVSVLEQYWTWSVGMTLTAAPRDLILEDLAGTISKLEITHIDLTPSLARLVHPDDVPSLTRGVFITGGEQLKQEILDAWGSKGVIYNAYGPTEATIGVTTFSRVPQNGRPSNIGKQFVNVGTYVFKSGTEIPVLRGGVGELCVSGKLVGKGYLGRDDLTAERFPTLKQFGERVYRTGDLVRILHDGCFDFLGRADDQVKLRGQRLELGEINHTIRTGVRDVTDVATLVVRNEKQGKDVLVSFVTTGDRHSQKSELRILDDQSASELSRRVQAACREKLPGYMVPTYVFALPFIPLSSNNKAETRRLRDLFLSLDHSQLMSLTKSATEFDISKDARARAVLRVLSAVTGIREQDLDLNSSIFDCRIDSISVMRFTAALKKGGFPQASPALILTHPKLGDLALRLSQQHGAPGNSSTLAARQLVQACHHKYRALVEKETGLRPEDIEYIAPCSALQEGMISRSSMPVTEGAYFNTFKYRLSNGVSGLKLRKAWTKLVETCSVLRTRFVSTPDGYIQVASKTANLPWTELCLPTEDDLDTLITEKRLLWVERNVRHVRQPLDIMVVSIGKKTTYMVVNISHGIYDAISLDHMLDRLRLYYLGELVSTSGPSYLEALVHGPLCNHTTSRDFWLEHLKSASHQPFPVMSENPSKESLCCSRQIPAGDLDSLRARLGVTHQAIIQAVWISVLQQFVQDVTFGIVISGRSIDLEGADSVIGPLFNTVAFHASLAPGETWGSLIKKCHEFNVSIIPFQHVALRDVQRWCSGGRPLFDTLFSFQRESVRPAGEQLWTPLESPPNPDYALAFEATLAIDGHLKLQLVTKAGVADMETLSSLLASVEAALHSVLTPELKVPLASHHQILSTSNGTAHQQAVGSNSDVYEWTSTALDLRDEIASMADVPAEDIAATRSLLELGLDSIDLIKLSSRLRARGITVTSGQLMREGTISGIIEHLELAQYSDSSVVANGTHTIQSISNRLKKYLLQNGYDLEQVEDVLPATPLQDSMVAEMIQSDFHRYFNHDVMELDSSIDIARLEKAWQHVVAASPILRTTFAGIDSPKFDAAYCQVIQRTLPLHLEQITAIGEEEFQTLMERARKRARAAAGRSSLLQLALVMIGTRRYLVLSIAHALYDGWSLALLHRDIQAAYYGTFVPRPEYKGHLARLVTASKSEARQFWSGSLAGAHVTLMPTQQRAIGSHREETHRVETGSSIPVATVQEFCRRYAVSKQVLGQACWSAVLASRTQSLDVAFGVVLSGRDTEEAESLLFPTMNTVVVRSVLHGGVVSWLRYMQGNMTDVASFQSYPLRDALKLAGRQKGPLFNSLFIQQRAQSIAQVDDVPWMSSVGGDSAVEYPVCIEVEVSDEKILWRAACSSDYMSLEETERLIGDLDAVLGYITTSPGADVLSFEGEGVSICGLALFEMPKSNPDDDTDEVVQHGCEDGSSWSEIERQIRSVLSEVSGIPESSVSRNHTIYHLGLDSISPIKVSSLLRKRGITLSVRQLLGADSIHQMAAMTTVHLTTNGAKTNGVSTNGHTAHDGAATENGNTITPLVQSFDVARLLDDACVASSEIEDMLPATAMQVHMLSVWQNTSGAVFFSEFTYSLRGRVNVETIRMAWSALAKRHPILRTSFLATVSRDMPFLQLVHRHQPAPVVTTNGRTFVNGEAKCVLSLPLAALHASQVASDCWEVRLKIHHALYDGVSLPILMDHFRQLLAGSQVDTPDETKTWKQWLSSQLSAAERKSRKTFWTKYLHGSSPPSFALLKMSSASSSSRTSLLRRAAIRDLKPLSSACVATGLSIQALFLAAYAKYLAGRTGAQDDVVFGVYLANRSSSTEMERLAYPTLALVPLRVRQPMAVDVVALAKSVQDDLYEISAPDNAAVGLWEVLDWTGVKVDSFVNFLSLPSAAGAGDVDASVVVEEVKGSDEVEVQSSADAGFDPEAERWLALNAVRDAYPDAVDIEAAVSDGSLDIGVFGPSTMVDSAGAEDVVSGIVDILVSLRQSLG